MRSFIYFTDLLFPLSNHFYQLTFYTHFITNELIDNLTYFLCLSSGFLVSTKYITYNQLNIPCKNASKTDLFRSQETTTAKTLPNPIPLLNAVFLISLFSAPRL